MAPDESAQREPAEDEAPVPFGVRNAYHEAGHAVVAYLTGHRSILLVTTVRWRRTAGRCVAPVRWRFVQLAWTDTLASLDAQAVFHAAGLVAEALLVGDDSVLGPQHWMRGADLWRIHRDAGRLGLSDLEQGDLARRTLDQALGLMEANWHLVSPLAEELLCRRRLWWWQVRRILRQAEREHGVQATGDEHVD